MSTGTPPARMPPDLAFLEHLRAATELLESMAADLAPARPLAPDDRRRLHRASQASSRPILERAGNDRERTSVTAKRRLPHGKNRCSIRRGFERSPAPAVTTPNVIPPEDVDQDDHHAGRTGARGGGSPPLLHLQAGVFGHPSLLRSAGSACGDRNFAARTSWPTCEAVSRC